MKKRKISINSKRGIEISLETLLGLIFVVFIIAIFGGCTSSCTRLFPDQETKYFNRFANQIKELSLTSNDYSSLLVYMKPDQFIVGFTKDSAEFKILKDGKKIVTVIRPVGEGFCSKTGASPCLCYCTKYKSESGKVSCTKATCDSSFKNDFVKKYYYKYEGQLTQDNYIFEGGFLVSRSVNFITLEHNQNNNNQHRALYIRYTNEGILVSEKFFRSITCGGGLCTPTG